MKHTDEGAESALRDGKLPINQLVYGVAHLVCSLYFKLGGLKIHGREHVPLRGAVIIAANHVSLLDPPLLGITCPRQTAIMAKSELFEKKTCGLRIGNFVCRSLGAFPVRRGSADRKALRRAIEVLQGGHGLVIFPEGQRSLDGELGAAEPGLGLIARATRAPILPVYIKGTEKALSKRCKGLRLVRTEVWFGAPFSIDAEQEDGRGRTVMEHVARRVIAEIADLRAHAHQDGASTAAADTLNDLNAKRPAASADTPGADRS